MKPQTKVIKSAVTQAVDYVEAWSDENAIPSVIDTLYALREEIERRIDAETV